MKVKVCLNGCNLVSSEKNGWYVAVKRYWDKWNLKILLLLGYVF